MVKILMPTDFSTAASNALEYAVELAEKLDATIDLIHIYRIPSQDGSETSYDRIKELKSDMEKNIDKQFGQFTYKVPATVMGKTKPVYGLFTAMEIADFAKIGDYDYIVMGMKGEHSRVEKWIGTVTTDTILKAKCPVIAVPENASFQPIESIVYATDFEPNDRSAVVQLMTFAGKMMAGIHFVNVNMTTKDELVKELSFEEVQEIPFSDFNVVAAKSVEGGLSKFASTNKMDMLALYIPNRRLFERLFHRRVSKAVALHTDIPLIVIHE